MKCLVRNKQYNVKWKSNKNLVVILNLNNNNNNVNKGDVISEDVSTERASALGAGTEPLVLEGGRRGGSSYH